MRPTSRPQSALRYPLDAILGTEAAVRVLRVMCLSDIPIGVSELARLAQLQKSGVARICTRLEDAGVLEAIGRGERNRQYRKSPRFALGNVLASLFVFERDYAQRILNDIAGATGGLPYVRAAWLSGPVALGTDRPGDAIVVGALIDGKAMDVARNHLWGGLVRMQTNHDVTIELRLYTMADLETANRDLLAELEHVIPLQGAPPLDLIPSGPRAGRTARTTKHEDLDARSSRVAAFVGDKLRRDPSLLEDARRYLERRMLSAPPGERLELEEWHGLLKTMSVARLRRFLLSEDQRAIRLRQSSPFLAVLSDSDRRAAARLSG
jgi:hypothetical protein